MTTEERILVHNFSAISNAISCLKSIIPRDGCGFTEEELDVFIHDTLFNKEVELHKKICERIYGKNI